VVVALLPGLEAHGRGLAADLIVSDVTIIEDGRGISLRGRRNARSSPVVVGSGTPPVVQLDSVAVGGEGLEAFNPQGAVVAVGVEAVFSTAEGDVVALFVEDGDETIHGTGTGQRRATVLDLSDGVLDEGFVVGANKGRPGLRSRSGGDTFEETSAPTGLLDVADVRFVDASSFLAFIEEALAESGAGSEALGTTERSAVGIVARNEGDGDSEGGVGGNRATIDDDLGVEAIISPCVGTTVVVEGSRSTSALDRSSSIHRDKEDTDTAGLGRLVATASAAEREMEMSPFVLVRW